MIVPGAIEGVSIMVGRTSVAFYIACVCAACCTGGNKSEIVGSQHFQFFGKMPFMVFGIIFQSASHILAVGQALGVLAAASCPVLSGQKENDDDKCNNRDGNY